LLAEKNRLKGQHPRNREEDGGIFGNKRRAGKNAVLPLGKKVEKLVSNVATGEGLRGMCHSRESKKYLKKFFLSIVASAALCC
jgi:hypothetical protein